LARLRDSRWSRRVWSANTRLSRPCASGHCCAKSPIGRPVMCSGWCFHAVPRERACVPRVRRRHVGFGCSSAPRVGTSRTSLCPTVRTGGREDDQVTVECVEPGEERSAPPRVRSTRRRSDADVLPQTPVENRFLGRTFAAPDGKSYRPSMFVPLTTQATLNLALEVHKPWSAGYLRQGRGGALGGIRTPNLLIRSQMLYPLSYERRWLKSPPSGNPPAARGESSRLAAASGNPAQKPASTAWASRGRAHRVYGGGRTEEGFDVAGTFLDSTAASAALG
jgi:hypothetical protein